MTAIRSARAADGKFVQISNDLIRDEELSILARFIVCYVLSLPPDHHFTAEWLETKLPGYGTRSIRAALNELKARGYMKVTRKSRGRGQWEWDQVISDGPIESASASPQVSSSERDRPDDGSSDDGRADKRSNTEDPKDVGPIDMASRRARAKAASAPKSQRTIQDAIDGVRAAVAATNSQADADDLTGDECMGLYFTYVKGRQPTDIEAYLTKIFGDAPYIDTFRANSEPWCCKCRKWESNCKCPAA